MRFSGVMSVPIKSVLKDCYVELDLPVVLYGKNGLKRDIKDLITEANDLIPFANGIEIKSVYIPYDGWFTFSF